jgi:hypothetical protein
MSLLDNEAITIKRYAEGTYDEYGNYTDGTETVITGEKGSIQPISGKEVLQVPEGDRFKQIYKLYTSYQVLVNDIIVRVSDSIEYEVKSVSNYASFGMLQHYKAILYLKDS